MLFNGLNGQRVWGNVMKLSVISHLSLLIFIVANTVILELDENYVLVMDMEKAIGASVKRLLQLLG